MNSFDVFDALIGRHYLTSQPIFKQMSREFSISNFVEARTKADTGGLGLDGIYDALGLGADVMGLRFSTMQQS